jgi:hypothetical protein
MWIFVLFIMAPFFILCFDVLLNMELWPLGESGFFCEQRIEVFGLECLIGYGI